MCKEPGVRVEYWWRSGQSAWEGGTGCIGCSALLELATVPSTFLGTLLTPPPPLTLEPWFLVECLYTYYTTFWRFNATYVRSVSFSIHQTIPKWPSLDAFLEYFGHISPTSCPLVLHLEYAVHLCTVHVFLCLDDVSAPSLPFNPAYTSKKRVFGAILTVRVELWPLQWVWSFPERVCIYSILFTPRSVQDLGPM